MNRKLTSLLCVSLVLWLPLSSAHSQPKDNHKLQVLQKKLQEVTLINNNLKKKETKLINDFHNYRQQVVAISQRIKEKEKQVLDYSNRLLDIKLKEQKLNDEFSTKRKQIAHLYRLVNLTKGGSKNVALVSVQPLQAVRATLLTKVMLPSIVQEHQHLIESIKRVAAIRYSLHQEQQKLQQTTLQLSIEQDKLNKIILKKTMQLKENDRQYKSNLSHLQTLNKEASSIKELLLRLEEDKNTNTIVTPNNSSSHWTKPPEIQDFPKQNEFIQPTNGTITNFVGQDLEEFSTKKDSVSIKGIKNSIVVAPFDGQIVHASHLGKLGIVVVIRHGSNYTTSLYPLAKLMVQTGQWVFTGEPIGYLGNYNELLVQMHYNAKIVNPMRWIKPDIQSTASKN